MTRIKTSLVLMANWHHVDTLLIILGMDARGYVNKIKERTESLSSSLFNIVNKINTARTVVIN